MRPKREEMSLDLAWQALPAFPNSGLLRQVSQGIVTEKQIETLLTALRAKFEARIETNQQSGDLPLYFSLRSRRLKGHQFCVEDLPSHPLEQTDRITDNNEFLTEITQIAVHIDNQGRSGVTKLSVAPNQELGEKIEIDFYTS